MGEDEEDLLVLFEVAEANKWQLISDESLRCGECFDVAFVIFDLVKIAGVYVAAQLRDHRGDSWSEKGKYMRTTGQELQCTTEQGLWRLLSLMVSKVHWSFLKNGCFLISSTPFLPNRTSLKTNR